MLIRLVLLVLSWPISANAWTSLCPPGTGLVRSETTGGGECQPGGAGDLVTLMPTFIPTIAAAVPTVTPSSQATPVPTHTHAPTYSPPATPTPMSAVYDPLSLAANTARCDTVTVTGAVTGRPILPMPQTTPAPGCVMSVPAQVTGANTVRVCWRNAFAATTACDTASSTWLWVQP